MEDEVRNGSTTPLWIRLNWPTKWRHEAVERFKASWNSIIGDDSQDLLIVAIPRQWSSEEVERYRDVIMTTRDELNAAHYRAN